MEPVRVPVLRMLLAAGFDGDLLNVSAGLDGDMAAEVERHADRGWFYHRRRWDLYRVLARLDRAEGPEACWNTTGYRSPSGHAMGSKGTLGTTSVARQVWMVTSGVYDLDPGRVVRHACHGGRRGCARPEHLIVGSRWDNALDEVRRRRGERIDGRRAADLRHMDVLEVPPEQLRELADAEAYFARLRPVGNGCLTVDGSRRDHYRSVTITGHRWLLHRYVLSHLLGRQLDGYALHGCVVAGSPSDNKQCVVHLSEGSLAQNTRHAYERGALEAGVGHPRAAFRSDRIVAEICQLSDGGWRTRALADRYGVNIWNVRRLIGGESYAEHTGRDRRSSKAYLDDRAVRTVRVLAGAGVDLAALAHRTGLSREYLVGLLAHRHRPEIGGPCLPPRGHARGEQVPTARLTRLRAAVARQRVLLHGESRAAVARSMGVSATTIERAVANASWREAA